MSNARKLSFHEFRRFRNFSFNYLYKDKQASKLTFHSITKFTLD